MVREEYFAFRWLASEDLTTYLFWSQGTSEGLRGPYIGGFQRGLSGDGYYMQALTTTPALSYTSSMLKIMKENGLFDWDFVSTLSIMLTLIVLSEIL